MTRFLPGLALLVALVLGLHADPAAAGGITIGGKSIGGFSIGHGQSVGPVAVQNSSIAGKLVNNGTVSGGSQPDISVNQSSVHNITNNGTITSNTTGISVTGSHVGTIVNNGTIKASGTISTVGIKIGP